jgi:hypothetical protein
MPECTLSDITLQPQICLQDVDVLYRVYCMMYCNVVSEEVLQMKSAKLRKGTAWQPKTGS